MRDDRQPRRRNRNASPRQADSLSPDVTRGVRVGGQLAQTAGGCYLLAVALVGASHLAGAVGSPVEAVAATAAIPGFANWLLGLTGFVLWAFGPAAGTAHRLALALVTVAAAHLALVLAGLPRLDPPVRLHREGLDWPGVATRLNYLVLWPLSGRIDILGFATALLELARLVLGVLWVWAADASRDDEPARHRCQTVAVVVPAVVVVLIVFVAAFRLILATTPAGSSAARQFAFFSLLGFAYGTLLAMIGGAVYVTSRVRLWREVSAGKSPRAPR